MHRNHWIHIFIFAAIGSLLLFASSVSASQAKMGIPRQQPTAQPRAATEAELRQAYTEWLQSAHADTYDDGLGANTTCAKCKSPQNWDPASLAVEAAQDCGACKRVAGAPRPELEGGIPVTQNEWLNIGCEVCHEPIGDSYSVTASFWNQKTQQYEPILDTVELCAHCHEGQHGFEVVEEQQTSEAHKEWACTRCHGVHGTPADCTDCHDPQTSSGAAEHARHPGVNCTACHDAGALTIWQSPELEQKHYGEYITRRFAHTLTSWPSHNLSKEVNCQRCHHPPSDDDAVLVSDLSCEACHEHEEGAVWNWCTYFERDANPFSDQDWDYGQP